MCWIVCPDVFTTGEFRTVLEVRGGGVPMGLRLAEQKGLVVNVKPGRFRSA